MRFIKKELDIKRFRYYEVNFEVTCDYHQKTSNVHKYVFEVFLVKISLGGLLGGGQLCSFSWNIHSGYVGVGLYLGMCVCKCAGIYAPHSYT